MKKFIQMHLGLIKYLYHELPKQKRVIGILQFLKAVGKAYFTQILKLYKMMFLIFDPTYQKQKKQYDNYQRLKVDLQRALKMLQYIDKKMEKQGLNRARRRQFWRDFFRDGQIRKEVFDELTKEIK